jgi:hypothetical protein
MPNIVLAEHGNSTELDITLASLADGSARQSDMINNVDNAQMVRVFYEITTGTSPTNNNDISIYSLHGDAPNISGGSNIRTDNAGLSDADITIETASVVEIITIDATSDKTYRGSFLIRNPGPEWGIAVENNTGVALNATGGNHSIFYITENQEIQ